MEMKEGKFGEESRRLFLTASWPLIVENDTHILVPTEVTSLRTCAREYRRVCMLAELASVSEDVSSPCFSQSYVRGFENGRCSYELALEDNYNGDPKTTIYYTRNVTRRNYRMEEQKQ